jgi:hypothetical protein
MIDSGLRDVSLQPTPAARVSSRTSSFPSIRRRLSASNRRLRSARCNLSGQFRVQIAIRPMVADRRQTLALVSLLPGFPPQLVAEDGLIQPVYFGSNEGKAGDHAVDRVHARNLARNLARFIASGLQRAENPQRKSRFRRIRKKKFALTDHLHGFGTSSVGLAKLGTRSSDGDERTMFANSSRSSGSAHNAWAASAIKPSILSANIAAPASEKPAREAFRNHS